MRAFLIAFLVSSLGILYVLDFTTAGQSNRFSLTSTAFEDGDPIPILHSCFANNWSPELEWENAPEDTESFALIMDDIDFPARDGFSHWVVFNIQSNIRSLDENILKRGRLEDGTRQGLHGSGGFGYLGPCPPAAQPVHRYEFTLYAIDIDLRHLELRSERRDVLNAIEDHILDEAELVGTYDVE